MRKYLREALAGLFLTMILLGGISVYTTVHLQANARLINYVGIVRGATQRLVKLELNHKPSDDILAYLDQIITELHSDAGEGEFNLSSPSDTNYQTHLQELTLLWETLKDEVYAYRIGDIEEPSLLAISEQYFDKANDTVFAAEEYTSRQLHSLIYLCVSMLVIMALVWAFLFWTVSKKMLHLESTNRRLTEITKRDSLTGVYLLTSFKEQAQKLIQRHNDVKYAVIYTDFADFKYINDVFGYAYGDSILTHYGKLLLEEVQVAELCGRVSADHFVLLMKYKQREELINRLKHVDQGVLQYMENSYDHHVLSTCCGICCLQDVDEQLKIDGYLNRANLVRSTVKSGVNPNYMFYNNEIRQHLMEEKNLESQLHEAFVKDEFIVYYQPKVDVKSGQITSAEALVRWCLNDEKMISPDRFIPILERTFMINQLDQIVMNKVCIWLRQNLDKGMTVLPISVNVSRLQFYDQNFVERYVEIRDHYKIPSELIEIEFTESIVFDNILLLESIIVNLKQHQFLCSIDDFGKGYSSLSLLKDLPVDYLKIDSYFFQESNDVERDFALIQGIVDMAHKLHMKTIAEGIESPKQVKMLQTIGCDYIQGYIYFKPMNEKAFAALLQSE